MGLVQSSAFIWNSLASTAVFLPATRTTFCSLFDKSPSQIPNGLCRICRWLYHKWPGIESKFMKLPIVGGQKSCGVNCMFIHQTTFVLGRVLQGIILIMFHIFSKPPENPNVRHKFGGWTWFGAKYILCWVFNPIAPKTIPPYSFPGWEKAKHEKWLNVETSI